SVRFRRAFLAGCPKAAGRASKTSKKRRQLKFVSPLLFTGRSTLVWISAMGCKPYNVSGGNSHERFYSAFSAIYGWPVAHSRIFRTYCDCSGSKDSPAQG